MSWKQVRCWTLTCDVCADGWTSDAGQPHFDSRDDARAHALGVGWIVTALRALCSECQEVQVCALAGHRWGRWAAAGPFPSRGGGTWSGRVRYCGVCTVAEWDPPTRRGRSELGEAS